MNINTLLPSIAVYMVALVLVTEFFKKWININPLILSWALGLLLCVALHFLFHTMTPETVYLFIVITGLTNSAYKWTALKRVVKTLIKGRV